MAKTENKSEVKKNRRRQLIFRRVVLDNYPLPLKEMRELLDEPGYDEKAAKRDVDSFQAVGCRIELRECVDKRDKEFVFLEGPHTDDDSTRETINTRAKHLVGRLAASLICGIPAASEQEPGLGWLLDQNLRRALDRMAIPDTDDKVNLARIRSLLVYLAQKNQTHQDELGIGTANDILKMLNHSSVQLGKRQDSLRKHLYRFWSESNRLVAIDSGTTNILVSRYLRKLNIPLAGSPLCSLSVCTNSRRIFEELGPSHVWVKTIIIGGQQKFRSPTIAGTMAELFLRSVSILQFGMCILGSTRVDLDRFAVCSDSQEESSIKNLLMERSSLKVICVDDSKLQSGPGREGYRFASIDPKHIDIIVTNSPLISSCDREGFEIFMAKVQEIEARGVPVIIATSAETHGFHKADEIRQSHRR